MFRLITGFIILFAFSFNAMAAKTDANGKPKYKKPNKNVQTYIKLSDGRTLYSGVVETPEGGYKAVSFSRVNYSTAAAKALTYYKTQQYIQDMAKKNALDQTKLKIGIESSLKLPADTATFFVAIGAVIAYEMMTNYAGNPLAMQKHFESLTDPMAHFSFLSFILANGYSASFITKRGYARLDEAGMKKLFRSLPYKSMFWGSLASNLASDVGGLLKSCAADMQKESKERLAQKENLMSHCDEALRQWTLPNKFNQYVPLIMSLYASQYLSEQLVMGLTRAGAGMNGMVVNSIGFDIMASTGGRIAVTGLRLIGNPVVFMGLDMLITSPLAQRTWSTGADSIRLKSLKEETSQTVTNCMNTIKRGNAALSGYCLDLKEHVLNWKDRNQSWRTTVNADFENGFAQWSELVERIDNQSQAAQLFYGMVAEKIFQKEKLIQTCNYLRNGSDSVLPKFKNEAEKKEFFEGKDEVIKICDQKAAQISDEKEFSLTRIYPLYGVLANGAAFNSEKPLKGEELKLRIQSEMLDKPVQVEAEQLKFVSSRVKDLDAKGFSYARTTAETSMIDRILTKLTSGKAQVVGQGLADMNAVLADHKKLYTENKDLWVELNDFRTTLGNPMPILTPGLAFPYVYAGSPSYKKLMNVSNYGVPFHRYPYSFEITSQYLMHEMICANETATMTSLPGTDSVFRSFVPPRMVDSRLSTNVFCQHMREAKDTKYSLYFMGANVFDTTGTSYSTPTDYIMQNRTAQILPAVVDRNDQYNILTYKKSNFEDFWLRNAEPTVEKFYVESQVEWLKIYTELIASFKDEGYVQDKAARTGIVKTVKGFITDQSSEAKNPLQLIHQEKDLYVDVLQRLAFRQTELVTTMADLKSPIKAKDAAAAKDDSADLLAGLKDLMANAEKEKAQKEKPKKEKIRAEFIGGHGSVKAQVAATFRYAKAVTNITDYLKTIFSVNKEARNEQVIFANYYPSREKVRDLKTELFESTKVLKDLFIMNEESQNFIELSKTAMYGIESVNAELFKYLMAGFIMDKNALEDMKDMKAAMKSGSGIQLNQPKTANPLQKH